MKQIRAFQGYYRFLSNFYPAIVVFEDQGYPTVEHAYQAAKTETHEERKNILNAETPQKAKILGKHVTIRKDWDAIKIQIMESLLEQKFARYSDLARRLSKTGRATLIEGNKWHDNFWGSCVCPRCKDHGMNHLGKLLMKIRSGIE